MPLPCGCFCLPQLTFADCKIGAAAVGPAVNSANPRPGSVRCSAFTDYAPTRWFITGSHIFYPVATGPLLTDTWQSGVVSPGAGKSYYDTLTIVGKDVGEVTLVRTYLSHPDPSFPATVTWTNHRHLDEHNPLPSPTTRNLKSAYMLRVEIGDPGAEGYEESYDPYTPWIGEIPCFLTLTPYVDSERTPLPGSDYTYANIHTEFHVALTGPHENVLVDAGGSTLSVGAASPTTIDEYDVSIDYTLPFRRFVSPNWSGDFGVDGVPIWASETNLLPSWVAPNGMAECLANSYMMQSGFSPPSHPYWLGPYSGTDQFDVDEVMPDFATQTYCSMSCAINRGAGTVETKVGMTATVRPIKDGVLWIPWKQWVDANTTTYSHPQDAEWFNSPIEKILPSTAYEVLHFYGPYTASPTPRRWRGEYRLRLTDAIVRYTGPS